jgi:nicotinamide riboside kinase
MIKIAFVGAPGSGKTTISTQVFSELKIKGFRTEHVHEWIRNDIQKHGAMTSIWEQYRTRQHQKDLEDAVPETIEYCILDGGIILPYFYSVLYANPTEPRQRLVLQDMYKYLLDDIYLNRYDMIFYVPLIASADLNDGTRYQTDEEVQTLDEHMRLIFTKLHSKNTHTVSDGFDKRLEEVMKIILSNVDSESKNDILHLFNEIEI